MAPQPSVTRDEKQPGNDRQRAVVSRARASVGLLPGALLLLAFQLFVAGSGALNCLQPPEHEAFVVSLVSLAISIVLLALLVGRRAMPRDGKDVEARLELTGLLVLAGLGALGGGLAGDFFVVGTRLTGSPGEGGLVGALILLVVCLPWF